MELSHGNVCATIYYNFQLEFLRQGLIDQLTSAEWMHVAPKYHALFLCNADMVS